MSLNTDDSDQSTSSKDKQRKEREKAIQPFWVKVTPHDLDVLDGGDHVRVTSCDSGVVGWWLGTLRAAYPQDQISGDGNMLKMHPDEGVTIKLNKGDGTLKIKGKKHLNWFKENFDAIVASGAAEDKGVSEMVKLCDKYLRIDDEFTVNHLLDRLPGTGAFKHGPTYIYRLWRALIDHWVSQGGDVYVITPQIDARRLADLLLILIKHRLSHTRLHLYTMTKSDVDKSYSKVLKEARDMIKDLKAPNKKRLVADERLKHAEDRLDVRFGRLYCKLIAVCYEDRAEVMVTSASFHKWHFDLECGDTVVHFDLRPKDLVNNYLAPLGLAHQVRMHSKSPSPLDTAPASPTSQLPASPQRTPSRSEQHALSSIGTPSP